MQINIFDGGGSKAMRVMPVKQNASGLLLNNKSQIEILHIPYSAEYTRLPK